MKNANDFALDMNNINQSLNYITKSWQKSPLLELASALGGKSSL